PSGDYLCFDYGTVRIGVAVGNALLGTARPLDVVANNSGTPNWALIDRAVEQWRPVALVVGIPLNLDGEPEEITQHARGFIRRLKKRYTVPVFGADERFSSMDAQKELQKMRARGQRGKTQHADVDTLAAALILERWFASYGEDL
ncbi:UNVERIFIED_CONTAM: hypothetical protein GTU68_039209, partial [Idotea baltica]|nr:hypothetical protein [Idotea baltica]